MNSGPLHWEPGALATEPPRKFDTHTHMHTHTHICTHTHTRTHICARTHTHTHWLLWAFTAMCRLSLVVVQSPQAQLQLVGLAAPQHVGILVPRPGSNWHPLHWLVDFQLLYHQGNPCDMISKIILCLRFFFFLINVFWGI